MVPKPEPVRMIALPRVPSFTESSGKERVKIEVLPSSPMTVMCSTLDTVMVLPPDPGGKEDIAGIITQGEVLLIRVDSEGVVPGTAIDGDRVGAGGQVIDQCVVVGASIHDDSININNTRYPHGVRTLAAILLDR